MNFWWVNHSKSYRAELAGGYIWCPQVHPGDVQRTPWLNVAKVLPGDMIISYAKQHVRAVGIATTAAFDSPPKPGYAENGWKDLGWEVTVKWEMLPLPFSLKPFVETISPFLASKNAPLKPNGDAQLAYLTSISRQFGDWLIRNVGVNEALVLDMSVEAEVNAEDVPPTQKVRLYQARLGQGIYRREVLLLEPRCRLTGVSNPNFLIASHIKPWRDSSNSERLDRHNGLMLAPHVDRLFDQGWISFEDSGALLIVPEVEPVIAAWGLTARSNVGVFSRQTAGYLKFHRDQVFRGH
ncbi:HNH endonuclease [Achromobacter sp.]|uniref:HNH endonuclease n=1 Tax=Achromobacter sp. TaxID=134375 RepID=UPI0028977814|nr:HNH endonuclease [Achromobacter sp.]